MGGSKRLNFRQGGHVFGASQPLAVYWTRSAPERWKDDEHNLQDIAPVGKAFGSSINQDLGVETIEVIWREICESFNYRRYELLLKNASFWHMLFVILGTKQESAHVYQSRSSVRINIASGVDNGSVTFCDTSVVAGSNGSWPLLLLVWS